MKRVEQDDDAASLDSLLDTMTNVVGILVIVLVVTQLGVGDAVKQITAKESISDEQLAKVLEDLDLLAQQQAAMKVELEDLAAEEQQSDEEKKEELRNKLSEEDKQLKKLFEAKNKLIADQSKMELQAQLTKDKKEQMIQEKKQLDSELDRTVKDIARLEAILDRTPQRKQLPPKQVMLPNPRPAPDGASEIKFICASNKIYPLDLNYFIQTARKRTEAVVLRNGKKLVKDPAKGIDPDLFLQAFKSTQLIRNQFFELDIVISGGRYPRMILKPRSSGGFDSKQLLGARSQFHRDMRQTDKSKFYARFYVLPDSYDIYMDARRVYSAYGMLAGWQPVAADWTYQTNIGGKVTVGPPPKPDPNPKPKPKPTKPSKPSKPKPKPNVID